MEGEKGLSVGPPGPGASTYLPGQVRCWARGPFLVLVILHPQACSVCLILMTDIKRFMIVSHVCCCSLIPLRKSLWWLW